MKTTAEERDTWAKILSMADDTEKKILIGYAQKILADFSDLESALAEKTARLAEAEAFMIAVFERDPMHEHVAYEYLRKYRILIDDPAEEKGTK